MEKAIEHSSFQPGLYEVDSKLLKICSRSDTSIYTPLRSLDTRLDSRLRPFLFPLPALSLSFIYREFDQTLLFFCLASHICQIV